MTKHEEDKDELEIYGDGSIQSKNAQIPKWLKLVYLILPFWGLLWLILFWNGSFGWFDRGSWQELQKAANTTFPYENVDQNKK